MDGRMESESISARNDLGFHYVRLRKPRELPYTLLPVLLTAMQRATDLVTPSLSLPGGAKNARLPSP
jgi:hypothetical protein